MCLTEWRMVEPSACGRLWMAVRESLCGCGSAAEVRSWAADTRVQSEGSLWLCPSLVEEQRRPKTRLMRPWDRRGSEAGAAPA